MTKLNVVIPAVNVTVDGVEFRKVDRKAQAGDIVRFNAECWRSFTEDAFYAVINHDDGLCVVDDDGDNRFLVLTQYTYMFEVYAPVFADPSAEITFDNAKYRKVDRSAREGDVIVFTDEDEIERFLTLGKPYVVTEIDWAGDPQITDDDGDDFDACGCDFDVYEKISVEYREVKRKAAVGERIKIVNTSDHRWTNGEEFPVMDADSDGDVYVKHPEGKRHGDGYALVGLRQYVVLEPVNAQVKAQPERLTVGDYAKIIADAAGLAKIGAIIKITKDRADNSAPYDGEYADGMATPVYFRESELEPATEAEFLAQRKPAEPKFNVGDSVKLTIADGEKPCYGWGSVSNGDIGKVTRVFGASLRVDFPKQRGWDAKPEELAKVTAEEIAALASIEKEAQEIAKWAKLGRKVGEFKRGDIVEAKRVMDDCSRVYGQVKDEPMPQGSGSGAYIGMGLRLPDGGYRAVTTDGATLIVPVEQRFDTQSAA
ncbi:hypothetical protein [Paenibacillus sp. B-A-8]|uniref:hypothetical protein n=1 Tax=Paenibacillus sp. B-A-8 TaxID=3400419 RepID=UPI003B010649